MSIKTYFFFSFEGEGLPIALQLQNEGCNVIVGMVTDVQKTYAVSEKEKPEEDDYTKKKRLRLYDGLLLKKSADDLLRDMEKITNKQNYFVYCEMNHLFWYAQKVKAMGFPGNYPTEDDYLFELDRKKAHDFVAKNYPYLKLLPTHTFTDIHTASTFLQESDEMWVVKGFDIMANVIIPQTNVRTDARKQLLTEMKKNKTVLERSGFLLEKYVSNLIEYLPQRIYYNGKLLAITVDIENKTMGEKNIGMQTGCAQDLVFPVALDSKINRIAFPPIIDDMAKQHCGLFLWDASLLIDANTDEIYFGEYCANRFGYNEIYTQLSQMPSVSYFFEHIIAQKNPYRNNTFGLTTRIFHNKKPQHGHIVSELPCPIPQYTKHFWPMDVYKKKEQLLVNGYDSNLAVVSATGQSIPQALTRLSENLEPFSDFHFRSVKDFSATNYSSAIFNRLRYGVEKGLFCVPFAT